MYLQLLGAILYRPSIELHRSCYKTATESHSSSGDFKKVWSNSSFGPRRDEVTGEWRRLHNEELNDLYCSPNIVRVIKSRRIRWVGHVAHMGEERVVYRVLVEETGGKETTGET